MVDYERAIFQLDVTPSYGFWDDPEWGVDLHKDECLFVFHLKDEIGWHTCNLSALWDDMTGYVDKLQKEEELPEGKYVVTYFKYDGHDLLQLADVGISKQQIIENVKNQKYVEGADYFLMPQ